MLNIRTLMPALHEFLAADHDRLDALLQRAVAPDGSIDYESYNAFRIGLLRHIWIEEKVLFPELRKARGETELVRQLHRDHAALSALLVPPPSPAEIAQITEILQVHNPLEEEDGGLYEVIEALAASELDALMERVHAIPEVTLARHADTPIVRASIETLVKEAKASRS